MIIRKSGHTKLVRRNNLKKISGDFNNLVIPIFFSRRLGRASVPRCSCHDPGKDTATPNKALLTLLAHGDLTIPLSLTKFDSGSSAIPSYSFHAENKIGKRERK